MMDTIARDVGVRAVRTFIYDVIFHVDVIFFSMLQYAGKPFPLRDTECALGGRANTCQEVDRVPVRFSAASKYSAVSNLPHFSHSRNLLTYCPKLNMLRSRVSDMVIFHSLAVRRTSLCIPGLPTTRNLPAPLPRKHANTVSHK